MANLTYPGVYIEEFTPGAPIQGVGTNVAAFLGGAGGGPPNEPRRITSFDAFEALYDDAPTDGLYLWYAVRGFFENGGTVCYVVRTSTASYDEATLVDLNGEETIVVRARELGDHSSDPISVESEEDDPAVSGSKLYRPDTLTISNASGTSIVVTSATKAAQYRPGDVITWTDIAEPGPVVVTRVTGTTVSVAAPIEGGPYANKTLRLADLEGGASQTFRVKDQGDEIGPGSVLHLTRGTDEEDVVVRRVTEERITSSLTTYRVDLRKPVTKDYDLSSDVDLDSIEFKLTIAQGTSSTDYEGLSMDPDHPRYFADVIAADASGLVTAEPKSPPSLSPPPENRPATAGPDDLGGGQDDRPADLNSSHYEGGLEALRAIDDVNMICAPGRSDVDVQSALISHSELMQDRFAILDSRLGAAAFGPAGVEGQRPGVTSPRGYAALYYPWLQVSTPTGRRTLVPPSGHVAGVYARMDDLRGVHKAPAGEEATVNGALGVERTMSDIDQGLLNLQGINVVRVFRPGGRPLVWGARTTASDTNWQYVNIRRLFLYLEESIQEGIDWAVFEPNNLQLWQKLKRTITAFLTRAWRDGALFGATAEDAFYVRIDEALNPFSEQQLGRLYIEIGCRPSYPAEFIVVRIGIWEGGSEITES
jgi:Bacteriophage tail sheath protein